MQSVSINATNKRMILIINVLCLLQQHQIITECLFSYGAKN